MIRSCTLACLLAVAAPAAFAQERFALAVPDSAVRMTGDVEYANVAGTRLAMDVYRPAAAPAARVPALVFFHRAVGAQERRAAWPSGWARAAVSHGIVAVVADLRSGSEPADFSLLLAHLTSHAAEYGIDPLVVIAGSGNAFTALPVVEDPTQTSVKAAVMLYGASPVTTFRLDLPLLLVRAGLDRPGMNRIVDELAATAIAQNAPVTLLNHPGGQHAFDVRDNDDASRAMIERVFEFVESAASAPYQAALRAALPQAAAAGFTQTGKFKEAAAAYATLAAAQPDNAPLRLSYGEALLGDKQYGAACAEFEKLKGKGLGPRDLALPAAKACLGKGDAAAAVGWLASIPVRFRPVQLRDDPAFAALRERADFKALFEGR